MFLENRHEGDQEETAQSYKDQIDGLLFFLSCNDFCHLILLHSFITICLFLLLSKLLMKTLGLEHVDSCKCLTFK